MRRSEDMPCGSTCGISFENLRCLSDEELFAHLEHEDPDAVAVLYQRYKRLVFAVALKILRDDGEAEDVVQNVFVDIVRTTLRYDPSRGTVKIWILQFAYHRSFRRRRQLTSRHFYSNVGLSEIQNDITASNPVTSEVENRHLLSKALSSLKGSQRHVLELASRDDLSLRDIAKVTGETLGNIRHHYYRGLQTLRARLIGRTDVQIPPTEEGGP